MSSATALAQSNPANDVLGPAAKIADQSRLATGWGLLGGVVVLCMVGLGVGLKERRLLFGAGLLLGGIIIWYTGADIIKAVIPTSGTPLVN